MKNEDMKKKIEKILADIQEKGYRHSLAREAILEGLVSISRPVSVPELVARIARSGKIFNKTTLYRELETLKKFGFVEEVLLQSDRMLYELSGEHHHHLVCVSCGEIRDVKSRQSLAAEERRLSNEERFTILNHSLQFFGLCGKCQ